MTTTRRYGGKSRGSGGYGHQMTSARINAVHVFTGGQGDHPSHAVSFAR
jgi:hypothetical protein